MMEDQLNDIALELERLSLGPHPLQKEMFVLGSDFQRVMFFHKLRELIQEKDMENDDIASSILGWAYEKLSN